MEAAVADALVVLHREGLLRPRQGILEEAAYLVGIEVSELRAAQQRAKGPSPELPISRATVPPSRGEGQRPASSSSGASAAPSTYNPYEFGKPLSPEQRVIVENSGHRMLERTTKEAIRLIGQSEAKRRGLHERSLDYKRCESCQELKALSCFYKDDDKWCRSCSRKFTRKAEERYRKSLCPTCGGALLCERCGDA